MCTELFLAIIYFSTIFVVNFFLYKLLKSYLTNILYLLKVKNILKCFSKNQSMLISIFYLCSKNEFKNQNLLINLNKFSTIEDSLIIGNTYKYFSKNLDKQNNQFVSLTYYLKLLESQYLPNKLIK
jgi:hypothetical protein